MTRRKKTQFHGGGRQKNLANETPGDAMRRSKVSLGGSSVVMIISSWPGKKKERRGEKNENYRVYKGRVLEDRSAVGDHLENLT